MLPLTVHELMNYFKPNMYGLGAIKAFECSPDEYFIVTSLKQIVKLLGLKIK